MNNSIFGVSTSKVKAILKIKQSVSKHIILSERDIANPCFLLKRKYAIITITICSHV